MDVYQQPGGINESFVNHTNNTSHLPGGYDNELDVEDTNWILTSSFIIFTMQTGFGMLEAGCVSIKNEVNIMMKNVVDIVIGGFTYWMFGYGMSFGKGPYTNPFVAFGGFFIDPKVGDMDMGPVFAAFLFQLSFATTATTIVSGAMAERCNFKAYCVFSFLNTVIYCIPAGWVWGDHGFLYNLGAVDIAGSGPVHLIGGSAAFASAFMLGPRLGRYSRGRTPLPPGSPVNAVLGLFVLWWGWLAFNSGSTYGVSGMKWQYAARAAVMTMLGSFGGGFFGLLYSLLRFKGKLDVMDIINSILGALVSITAGCFLYHAWEALFIGLIGGMIACFTMPLVDLMGVDDPVGASSVHGFCGIWGVISVGLFADNPIPLDTTQGRMGLFKGGGTYLLKIQCLSALCLSVWGLASTTLLLWLIDKFIPIRMEKYEELIGADLTEHMIKHGQVGIDEAVKLLKPYYKLDDIENTPEMGLNLGHYIYMSENYVTTDENKNKNPRKKKDVESKGDLFTLFQSKAIDVKKNTWLNKDVLNFNASRIYPERIGQSGYSEFLEYNGENYQVIKFPKAKLNDRNTPSTVVIDENRPRSGNRNMMLRYSTQSAQNTKTENEIGPFTWLN
ncbi:ammonium transporter [Arctopsyche grandis]|uniref:ammonium transporter n=1 Tax=Arctopsyche grandis TaxID=121162 RepID=UPI00406D9032